MANHGNKNTSNAASPSKPAAAGEKAGVTSPSVSPSPAAGANPFKGPVANVKSESKAVEPKGLDANVPAKYRKFQKQ